MLPDDWQPEPEEAALAREAGFDPDEIREEMADWARERNIKFTAYGPKELCEPYRDYIKFCRANVVLYPWAGHIEDLALCFQEVSHFLFVLPPSKEGTGGSATSPRYAGFFNRPVIVVDDEDTFERDGFYVFRSLEEIKL